MMEILKKYSLPGLVSFTLFCLIMACAATQDNWSPPAMHVQEEGEDLRYCLDCHDAADENFPYRRYVHTPLFSENHRVVANQNSRTCNMCHKPSDCDNCHGVGIELKPSTRHQTRPDRRMPHPGDYLSRHRIDGRIDPVSCHRCHGNPKTAQTCKTCHG